MNKYILNPFNQFIKLESSSGILLIFVTILALILANSPLSSLYQQIWNTSIGFNVSKVFSFEETLLFVINDIFMTFFFFLIGLEIKRELFDGELKSPKDAAFPIVAALGGIVGPIVVYFLLNNNPATSNGWAIPMATDTAFSLAILKMLGSKIPMGLKVFLTAFAIIDDIAAILIMAVFYSGEVGWHLILLAMIILLLLYFMGHYGFYSGYVFLVLGIVVWVLFLNANLHPTIAGILVAFTIPFKKGTNIEKLIQKLKGTIEKVEQTNKTKEISMVYKIRRNIKKSITPLERLEYKMHGLVAYIVLPLFALANAGVTFGGGMGLHFALSLNIILSLIIGKIVGISLFSFIGVKTKIVRLAKNVNFTHIIGVASLAGIGFTMSIFITGLAFEDQSYVDASKIGILIGSLLSALLGYIILRFSKMDKAK